MSEKIENCPDCKKQRQLAIACTGPLGYSAKCKKHSPVPVLITEITNEKV